MNLSEYKILKVDDNLGVVLGWGIICKQEGEDYFDVQGHHIPEEEMFGASVDFMMNSQIHKEMHSGDKNGKVVFMWPMTTEVAKAYGIETKTTGLMIGIKPEDPAVLEKFRDGTYTGFSLGGTAELEEVVE